MCRAAFVPLVETGGHIVAEAPPALWPYDGAALGVCPTMEPAPQDMVWPPETEVSLGGVVVPLASAMANRAVQRTFSEAGDVNW